MARWWKSKGESLSSLSSGNTHSSLSSSPWFEACVRPGGADVIGEGRSVTATYWICACHTTLRVTAGPGQQVPMKAAMAAYNTCSFLRKHWSDKYTGVHYVHSCGKEQCQVHACMCVCVLYMCVIACVCVCVYSMRVISGEVTG